MHIQSKCKQRNCEIKSERMKDENDKLICKIKI